MSDEYDIKVIKTSDYAIVLTVDMDGICDLHASVSRRVVIDRLTQLTASLTVTEAAARREATDE